MAADENSKNSGPFDVRTVKALVALMSQHDLNEIFLQDGRVRLRLRRGGMPAATVVSAPLAYSPQVANPAPVPSSQTTRTEPSPAAPGRQLVEIKSPTPGTFYAASSPDAQPFVKVGDRVSSATVVCLIEAMKIFNEIPADTAGVITEILVQNQQAVEYGQVLFRVDPTS